MTKKFIPVAAPMFVGNEKAYVAECLDSTWISSAGGYVGRFEKAFAEFCRTRHAVACCNGTAALHLALMALGIGPGDEVIIPTLTFVATANAVTYCGARPVCVDCESETWNIDPTQIESKITPHTRAILVVHLYGSPAEMEAIAAIARRHNLFVIEDAAEAHGAEYRGRKIGSIGEIACFSFYGNKILTTGEGGMVSTSDEMLAERVRRLAGQGMDPDRRYWFPEIGYNYRMMNVSAAIGLAQLEKIEWHLRRRREVVSWYLEELKDAPDLSYQLEQEGSTHAHWLFTVVLGREIAVDREQIMQRLAECGIETRPVFYPVHILPPYKSSFENCSFPVAERIARRGLSLPTWAGLSREDVRHVCGHFLEALRSRAGRSGA